MTDSKVPDVYPDPLAVAMLAVHKKHGILLDTAGVPLKWGEYVAAIRAALPPDAHLFTVDSLAALVDQFTHYDPDANEFGLGPSIVSKMMTHEFAAAIIVTAKEAERE
jgi:hypothetical protein